MRGESPAPCAVVIFGATGDLAKRKLLPALFHLAQRGWLPDEFRLIGSGREPMTHAAYRDKVRQDLVEFGPSAPDERLREWFDARVFSAWESASDADSYEALARQLNADGGTPSSAVFYLAVPPSAVADIVDRLGALGLLAEADGVWRRVIVEKPFGYDLASARALNARLQVHLEEHQIYRIDHYLGKETVQNLMAFRFANGIFEPVWNRRYIDHVQITVAETVGVESRGRYYDGAGALRDMVQNHLTQLLTLVAMEVPTSFSADAIRNEKIKVLHSLRPLRDENVVRGRYTAGNVRGELVGGYLDEPGVPADSRTETFIAMKMFVDSWRWQGVPFYLRTGKCMPHKTTQIAVRFRAAPVSFFEQYGCTADTHDVLTITLQPNEGFAFYLDIKRPGSPLRLERIPLRFHYDEHFEGTMPDAYQTLLLDVLNGDQTLFVHAEEVEESWRVYTPLIESPPPVVDYAAGTWGPPEAESLAIPEKDLWQRSKV
jgi:glucose-6-phosphate 1-dehydrogenase